MPWNTETSVANEKERVVTFHFETDKGPGHVTAIVPMGTSIEMAKAQLLATFEKCYVECTLTKYIIDEIRDTPTAGENE